MRLNNFISSTGLCSRERLMINEQKKVKVNGEIATLGVRVGPEDKVE
jgi:16S rRNA U516 pseudouridylate synthase RsuA-like enzyme